MNIEYFHQSQSHIYNVHFEILSNYHIDPIKLPLKCNFHRNSCKNPLPFPSSSLMIRDQSTRKGVRKRLKRESSACEEAVSFGRSEDSVGTSFQAKRQRARRCYSVQLLLASFCSLNQFPLPFPPPTLLLSGLPQTPSHYHHHRHRGIYQDHHCAGSLERMIRGGRERKREKERRLRKSLQELIKIGNKIFQILLRFYYRKACD